MSHTGTCDQRGTAMATAPMSDPATVRSLAEELTARDRWPRAQVLAAQRAGLQTILRHAISASPYYRDVLGAAAGGASLTDLPVLTKTTLMAQWDRLVTDSRVTLRHVEAHLAGDRPGDLVLGEYRACATGGTTGERAVMIYDRSAWTAIVANVLRWVRVMGATPETRVVGIGAPTALHITNRAFAELRAGRGDAPRLSVLTPLPVITDALNSYQPELILTYASFVRPLIEEQAAGRLRIRPRTISTSAEMLAPEIRDAVAATWGAATRDTYGTTESGLIGVECEAMVGVHVAEDLLILEVVNEANQAVAPGTRGAKMLLTSLFNRALPLIRYEMSDLLTMAVGPCPCGRPYSRIASIEGRREDYLRLPRRDGGFVQIHAARLGAPLSGVAGLRQFQFVPTGEGLRLRITVRQGASPDDVARAALRVVKASLASARARVETAVDVVDRIETVGTGAKHKLVGAGARG